MLKKYQASEATGLAQYFHTENAGCLAGPWPETYYDMLDQVTRWNFWMWVLCYVTLLDGAFKASCCSLFLHGGLWPGFARAAGAWICEGKARRQNRFASLAFFIEQ